MIKDQWTLQQFRERQALKKSVAPKRSKYGNIKAVVDGVVFDSRKEAKRYAVLKMLQQQGKISGLERQKAFKLKCKELVVNGMTVKLPRAIITKYVADFVYKDENGNTVVEDVKSEVTRKLKIYKLKKMLMNIVYGITIFEK